MKIYWKSIFSALASPYVAFRIWIEWERLASAFSPYREQVNLAISVSFSPRTKAWTVNLSARGAGDRVIDLITVSNAKSLRAALREAYDRVKDHVKEIVDRVIGADPTVAG